MNDKQREREERPVGNATGTAGGGAEGGRTSTGASSTLKKKQPSALGGDVATRSGILPPSETEESA